MDVRCSVCGKAPPVGTLGRCPACHGILAPVYSEDELEHLAHIQPGRGIDRYRAMLPVSVPIPYLGEGDTPLIPSRRLGASLGLPHLYFKNEGLNPSGAFKDRAGAMTAALALEAKAEGIITASSGNASSAIAAYGAAAGLKCIILMEPGNPVTKLRQTVATGAKVLLIEGVFSHGPEALSELLLALGERIHYYVGFVWAPVNPYILEGIKTISYEIANQLPGAPDVLIGPVGGGDMFTAQWRGYQELQRAGLIQQLPHMIGVQSLNAPPLVEAFKSHLDHVATLPYARSRISGINVSFTGDHALAALRESGGLAIGVQDEEVLAMQKRLALEEGIWVEPAGAAAVAALPRLLERHEISAEQRIVCVMSGAGFKDTHLAEDTAAAITQQATLPLELEAISAACLGRS
ncbi:MAG: threonine synthase [Aggregatilineales bacterium]